MRRRRVWVVFALVVAGLLVVEARLVRLQWQEAELWARESRRSTMTFRTWPFERGWILDRHGQPLAMSEEVTDLVFRFRDWRRGSAHGQVGSLLWLLDATRRLPARLEAAPPARLDELAALPVETLVTLPGKGRVSDVEFYVRRLFGDAAADELSRLGALEADERRPGLRLGELPGVARGRAATLARAAEEAAAWATLAEGLGFPRDELLAAVGRAILGCDARAARRVRARAGRDALNGETYKTWRDTKKWVDDEARLVATGIDFDVETLVAIRGETLPGFDVRTTTRRTYPPAARDVATILLGKVGVPHGGTDLDVATRHRERLADLAAIDGALTAEELAEFEELRLLVREVDYLPDEEKGVLGLEAGLEPLLRGKRGWVATYHDPHTGEVFEESAPPQRGLNVTLTLDLELQRAAERVLDGLVVADDATGETLRPGGSIVLLDPRDGEVLALASSPRPRRAQMREDYARLIADPRRPLESRALGAGNLPPPGSTFKPVAALAMLEAGAIDARTELTCDRYLMVGRNHRKKCLGRHGTIDLVTALAESCNIYFYEASRRVPGDTVVRMAERFGLGREPGLLDNEVLAGAGLALPRGPRELPGGITPERLTEAKLMQLVVGQHPLDDVTPLQVAGMMAAIATGRVVPPTLLRSIEGYGRLPTRAPVGLDVDPGHLALVRRGLARVLETGTASEWIRGRDDPSVEWTERRRAWARMIAGKTGTPEVAGRRDHAWFAGWLPRDEPHLAFAVFVEHCDQGGSRTAVPAFRKLLEQPETAAWLEREVVP